jgi:hypothetical protein
MKVYGQLEYAQLHILSSEPTGTEGRIMYDSTAKALKFYNGTAWTVNTTDVSLGAVGAVPNANGASLTGQVLVLQPASGSQPGVLTAAAQTLGGDKTLQDNLLLSKLLALSQAADAATTGTDAALTAPTKVNMLLTNGSLVSIATIPAPSGSAPSLLVLSNKTGVDITVKDETGATAANRIKTGTGATITISNNASVMLVYDGVNTRWNVVGGTGSGGALDVGATQSIAAAGTITVSSIKARQLIPVAGNAGAQTAATTPFGAGPFINGTEVELVGTDDDNTLSISYNDAANGCVGSFETITLAKNERARFVYVSALARFIGGKS